MSVGITVLPARFTRVAPAGTRTSPVRPTAVKRLPVTTKVAFSIGARPSPTMTRAPSKTVTLFCASVVSGSAAIAARTRSFARCMAPSSEGTLAQAANQGNPASENIRNQRHDAVRAPVDDQQIVSREVPVVVAGQARKSRSQRRWNRGQTPLKARGKLAPFAKLFRQSRRQRLALRQARRQCTVPVV